MAKLSIADVLERAADILSRPGGWRQNAYASNAAGDEATDDDHNWPKEPNCFCILGAIHWAMGDTAPGGFVDPEYVKPMGFDRAYEVVTYNDTTGRTQDQVISLLRNAASLARQESR